jgi:hypothetical protein
MTVLRSRPFRFGLSLALVAAGSAAVCADQEPAATAGVAVQTEEVAVEQNVVAAQQEDVALGAGSKDAPFVQAPADPAAGTEEDGPVIQTLGEADQKIFLVDHKGTWSMHFENVITSNVILLWKQAGGPDITTKTLIDRTNTMSVHRLAPELIVERLFEGYGYTLHYDDAGRLTSVRVYSPRDSLAFKTPRLTESLGDWKKVETEAEAAPAPAAQP